MTTAMMEPPMTNKAKAKELPLQLSDVHVASELDKHILCCAITVHMWRGQFKIRDALVRVGEIKLADEIVTNPRWKLMPDAWSAQFGKVEQEINGLVDRTRPLNSDTHKFPLKGIDIIPRKAAPKLFKDIKSIETEKFNPLADKFVEAFPEIAEELKKQVGDSNFQMIRPFLPTNMVNLRSRFHIEKHVVPIHFSTAGEFQEYMGEEANEFAEEIGEYAKDFATSTAQTIVSGLQDEMLKAIQNLQERISDQGVIKGGTLDMVKRAFEKIDGFSFCMTPELLQKMKVAKMQLGATDHLDLNRDLKHGTGDVAKGLSSVLGELTKQCESEAAAVLAHGRARRSIE